MTCKKEKPERRSLTVAGVVAIGTTVMKVGGMFKWFKGLFAPPAPMKIEVTINVPAIHVFTYGSEASKAAAVIPADGSLSLTKQAGTPADNSAIDTQEFIAAKIAERLSKQQFKAPEVSFGFESTSGGSEAAPKSDKPTAGLT